VSVRASARALAFALLAAGLPASGRGAELVVNWAPLAVTLDGYQIERRVDDPSSAFEPIARVEADATRFVDRELSAGVRYCYRVRGVRGERLTPPSQPLCNAAADSPVRSAAPETALADTAVAAGPAAVVVRDSISPQAGSAEAQSAPDSLAAPTTGEFREVKALQRPPPAYPHFAQLNGISGWVKLMFTVTAAGTTRDVRVTASEPPGVFDAAAVEAARRFVYSPRLENGTPVDRPNVETEITFTWIDRGGSLTTAPRPQAPR
jgi:TonB family protein